MWNVSPIFHPGRENRCDAAIGRCRSGRDMSKKDQDILLACFRLGSSLYGVDVMRIREIVAPGAHSFPPFSATGLLEFITLRGTAIPVLEVRKRFHMAPRPDGIGGELMVVKLPDKVLALAVDEVVEVITVKGSSILPPCGPAGPASECILGVCLFHDREILVVDIDVLPDEKHALDSSGG